MTSSLKPEVVYYLYKTYCNFKLKQRTFPFELKLSLYCPLPLPHSHSQPPFTSYTVV